MKDTPKRIKNYKQIQRLTVGKTRNVTTVVNVDISEQFAGMKGEGTNSTVQSVISRDIKQQHVGQLNMAEC